MKFIEKLGLSVYSHKNYGGIRVIESKILRTFYEIYSSITQRHKVIITERVVEVPFLFENIVISKKLKILDFGCSGSKNSIKLALLGHDVTCVDLRDYEFTHPNINFIKGDFLENKFQDSSFDVVIAISAIEHCGMRAYGQSESPNADKRVVDEIYRILKKGGKFIITVPFGKKGITTGWRVYNENSLNSLLEKFKIKKEEFFIGINRKNWKKVKKEKISNVDSASKGFTQGVACVLAEK